ncbi:MAG: SDR family oxidoreductase [Pseudomonadales bacterium]
MIGMLQDKVAMITGAGSGIGKSTALLFAREGAKLMLAGPTTTKLEATAEDIKEYNRDVIWQRMDQACADDVQQTVAETVNTFGRLDCAFNNGAVDGLLAPTAEYPEEEWDRVVAINLKGVWNCLRFQIPALLNNGGGSIVNNGSAMGAVGIADMPAYIASKAGVIGLTRAAALDYSAKGVRINVLLTGAINTAMTSEMLRDHPEIAERMRESKPIGRLGEPEEVAQAALWLCSERSSYVTAAAIPVDGGFLAQ